MFVAGAIPRASLSRSRKSRATDTTWSNGWLSNRFVTGRLRCGAGLMLVSINGRQPRNFRHIWPRLFRPRRASALDYPSLQNVGENYDVQWFTFTSGKASQQNLFGDSKFWRTKFLDAYKKHIAFSTLDSFVGNPSQNFQRILKHPTADAYYDAMAPTKEQFQNCRCQS